MDEFEQNVRNDEQGNTTPAPKTQPQPAPVPGTQSGALAGAIREVLSSSKVLAMVILFAVYIFLNITSTLISKNDLYYQYGEIIGNSYGSELADEYYDLINELGLMGSTGTVSTLIGAVLGSAPMIITIIGFLLVYNAAKNADSPMTTTGFKILKVMNIIGLVCFIILAALACLLPVIFVGLGTAFSSSLYGYSYGTSGVTAIFVIVGIICAVFCVGVVLLYIFKNIGLNKSVNCLIGVFEQNDVKKGISGYAAVFTIIVGSFDFISALTSLISGALLASLAMVVAGIAYIMLGNALLTIKGLVSAAKVQ